jgi:hypothetical protein
LPTRWDEPIIFPQKGSKKSAIPEKKINKYYTIFCNMDPVFGESISSLPESETQIFTA